MGVSWRNSGLESALVKDRPRADRRTKVDGVSVVTLYGRIVFGEGSNGVREKVKSLLIFSRWTGK
jgi:hypothetical protein